MVSVHCDIITVFGKQLTTTAPADFATVDHRVNNLRETLRIINQWFDAAA